MISPLPHPPTIIVRHPRENPRKMLRSASQGAARYLILVLSAQAASRTESITSASRLMVRTCLRRMPTWAFSCSMEAGAGQRP